MDWKLSLAGLLIGLLVGTTGMGGGSLMTPLLVLVFGFILNLIVIPQITYRRRHDRTAWPRTGCLGCCRRWGWGRRWDLFFNDDYRCGFFYRSGYWRYVGRWRQIRRRGNASGDTP